MGAPAPGAPTAATFGLFLLPGGRPRHFFRAEEPATEADEESMKLGFFTEE
jgi:hypothetical protein